MNNNLEARQAGALAFEHCDDTRALGAGYVELRYQQTCERPARASERGVALGFGNRCISRRPERCDGNARLGGIVIDDKHGSACRWQFRSHREDPLERSGARDTCSRPSR